MRRKPASARRNQIRRTQPVAEGLEHRRLMSAGSLGHSSAAAGSANGVFSQDDRTFTFKTPTGGTAVIQMVGLGSLAGTTVDSTGALDLVYNGTNAYTKISGTVHGGGGTAPLASIVSGQLLAAGAQNSLSGVGGTVLKSVLLSDFNLVAGGNINLTPGVNTVILDSVGPDTQIHLRALPPPPTTTTTTNSSTVVTLTNVSSVGSNTSASTSVQAFAVTPFGTNPTTTTSSDTTLEAGQSVTVSSPYGTTTTYISNDKTRAQTLSGTAGVFTSAGNIVEPLPAGQPPQTVPPAPPGVIFKANQIDGNATSAVNLLMDSKIFGYDPTLGEVVRFDLDLANSTASVDPTFTPISVPGDPPTTGLNLGWNGTQLDLLVSSGTTVYAYNATTGAAVGSFTTSVPINSIASTDVLTVLGSYATNQLQMINLAASLQSGTAQPAKGDPQPFTPTPQFTLLGGLASTRARTPSSRRSPLTSIRHSPT